MSDNWFNHNTDKLLLFILVVLGGVFMIHLVHHGYADKDLLTWLENAFSTVLGALILILTGRVQRANNGDTNAPKTSSTDTTPAASSGIGLPTFPKQG